MRWRLGSAISDPRRHGKDSLHPPGRSEPRLRFPAPHLSPNTPGEPARRGGGGSAPPFSPPRGARPKPKDPVRGLEDTGAPGSAGLRAAAAAGLRDGHFNGAAILALPAPQAALLAPAAGPAQRRGTAAPDEIGNDTGQKDQKQQGHGSNLPLPEARLNRIRAPGGSRQKAEPRHAGHAAQRGPEERRGFRG